MDVAHTPKPKQKNNSMRNLGVCVTVCLTFLQYTEALYEKEAGHYDWLQRYVGHPTVLVPGSAKMPMVFVGTEDGYVGGILAETGYLSWRKRACSDSAVSAIDYNSADTRITVTCTASSDVLIFNAENGYLLDSAQLTGNTSGSMDDKIVGDSLMTRIGSIFIRISPGDVMEGYREDTLLWVREEALGSVSSVLIVDVASSTPADRGQLEWLIGSRPVMVAFSQKAQRLVGVDMSTGTTLWGKDVRVKNMETLKLRRSETREGHMELAYDSLNEDGIIHSVDVVTGEAVFDKTKENTAKNVNSTSDSLYRWSYDVESGRVWGGRERFDLWSLNLGGKILRVNELPLHANLKSVPAVVKGDATVVFKYINPNLALFVSSPAELGIELTLIDTVTGRVVYQSFIPEAAGSNSPIEAIQSALCENWLVVHYYNQVSGRFEVVVVDIFEKKAELGLMDIVTGRIAQTGKSASAVSAFELPKDLVPISKQFIFPLGPVTAIGVTATVNGVTPRQVVFSTGSGLLAIKKDIWLNPRRVSPGVVGTSNSAFLDAIPEDNLPAYNHTLPFIATDLISHLHPVSNFRIIETFPTHLESTSIVIAIGKDIYCTPVYIGNAPYDVLPPYFNYWMLCVSGAFVVAAVVIASILVKRKESREKQM